MAAYVIVRVLEVRDTAWRAEYAPKTAALVEKHGGKFLVRGGAKESLEGNEKLPSNIVVVEFPSMEHHVGWSTDTLGSRSSVGTLT
jgi:uncharacterized protein (DUF1330 family)